MFWGVFDGHAYVQLVVPLLPFANIQTTVAGPHLPNSARPSSPMSLAS
jgi:hypothetical protein